MIWKSLQDHRYTRVENPGEGVPDVFAKISRGGGGSGLSGKIARGSPYFLLTSFLKICLGGAVPSPFPPSLCASMLRILSLCPSAATCKLLNFYPTPDSINKPLFSFLPIIEYEEETPQRLESRIMFSKVWFLSVR